ncbi:MAG: glycerate dehydrogenase [Verrucomicrobia bacterium]|nr:glycerate dehydrogenase [Verrucomicrobiota bacterium]
MRIVVLDGATLNPGDLSWADLSRIAPCEVHDRTAPEDVLPRARGAEIVLTNKTVLSGETIAQLDALRYIGVLATGFNVVDAKAARARNIPVTNVPAYGTMSVAQHTVALLLELTNQVGRHAASVRAGNWARCPDFCFAETPLVELDGRTLGLIGSGRIAQAVAGLARALGMKVIFATRTGGKDELDRVLGESDVISLHCPLTAETRELINASTLARMKPTAFLINTSRGPLVAEHDLAAALNAGRLAGAAVDVLSTEPPVNGSPLIAARNCLVTPHHAWATQAARGRLMKIAVENVRRFAEGAPQNVVN